MIDWENGTFGRKRETRKKYVFSNDTIEDKLTPEFSESYYRSRRSYNFVAAILLAWEWLDLTLAEGGDNWLILRPNISTDQDLAVAFFFGAIFIFSLLRYEIEWQRTSRYRRNRKLSKLDHKISHILGSIGISVFIVQLFLNQNIAEYITTYPGHLLSGATVYIMSVSQAGSVSVFRSNFYFYLHNEEDLKYAHQNYKLEYLLSRQYWHSTRFPFIVQIGYCIYFFIHLSLADLNSVYVAPEDLFHAQIDMGLLTFTVVGTILYLISLLIIIGKSRDLGIYASNKYDLPRVIKVTSIDLNEKW